MTRGWRGAAWGIFTLAVTLLVVSQFTGIFYSVDAMAMTCDSQNSGPR